MKEYIDREAVFHAMKMDIRPPFAVVRDFPAADVVEVVHGKWEFEYMTGDASYYSNCTNCGKRKHFRSYLYEDNYCPNCGAKMAGE